MLQKIHPYELQNFIKINFDEEFWWLDLKGPYIFRDALNSIVKSDYFTISIILQKSYQCKITSSYRKLPR